MVSFWVECFCEQLTAEPHGGFWVQSESSGVITEAVLAKENRQNKAGSMGPAPWGETQGSEDSDYALFLSLRVLWFIPYICS